MKRIGWVALLLLLGAWDPVTKKQPDVAEGNKELGAGKADEAEKHYQKALKELGPSPGILYDLGSAHYHAAQKLPPGEDRKKLLESAEKELRLAGDAPETELRSSAHYNLGNTLFAEEKYKDAIEEYKKSLRLQPAREDARKNLELALAKIPPPPPPQQKPQSGDKNDQKQDQQQQQQQQQQSQNDKKDDDQKDQQGQNQDQDKQEDHQQKPEPEPSKDDQKQAQKGQEQKPEEAKKDDSQQRPQPTGAAEAGDRDMDRKLDLLEDKSKDLQVQRAQERARTKRRGQPVKDW